MLSIVVLEERIVDDYSDPYVWKRWGYYRVLKLDENNEYKQEIYNCEEELVEEYWPTTAIGTRFNYIPFYFAGSENNDPNYDEIPLLDLSLLNVGHYRNSADQEESGFIAGQPFPVVCIGKWSIEDFQ